jgi:hypothetical protein
LNTKRREIFPGGQTTDRNHEFFYRSPGHAGGPLKGSNILSGINNSRMNNSTTWPVPQAAWRPSGTGRVLYFL